MNQIDTLITSSHFFDRTTKENWHFSIRPIKGSASTKSKRESNDAYSTTSEQTGTLAQANVSVIFTSHISRAITGVIFRIFEASVR